MRQQQLPILQSCNVALGAFRGKTVQKAYESLEVKPKYAQVCPQNYGEIPIDYLIEQQQTTFLLHANVRVDGWTPSWDCSTFTPGYYWNNLKKVNRALMCPQYTLHAGSRRYADLKTSFDNVRRIEQFLECPVGIEGLYPNPSKSHLLSTWKEYEELLNSGLKFALDLSHLNIVSTVENLRCDGLVKELISSEHCIEVHISGNDGTSDRHLEVLGNEWWIEMLDFVGPNVLIFSEESRV